MKNYLLKHRIISIIMVCAVVILCYGAFLMVKGDSYTISMNHYFADSTYEDTTITYGADGESEHSTVIGNERVKYTDKCIFITFDALDKGTETVSILCNFKHNGDSGYARVGGSEEIKVGSFGIITNNQSRYLFAVLAIISFILSVIYFIYFRTELKNNKYSYDLIFYLSAALFTFILAAVWFAGTVYSLIEFENITTGIMETMNSNLIAFVVFISLPVMLVFAVAVSISNLKLMKSEGVRPVNALGIGLSFVMIIGFVLVAVLTMRNIGSSTLVIEILQPVTASLYLLFEVVLFSTIFCGIYVARYEPAYDKDFIIILGCKIRDDGTLYPLIRGRADRAIAFYEAQYKKTGRKAIFIPSGGQGSDEVISEGEAVAIYLKSRGIPEEQIVAETESTTTRENMLFSKKIADRINPDGNILFSTTNYHVFRSGIIASEAGLHAEGVGADTKWYFWPNAQLREVAGLFLQKPKKQLIIMAILVVLFGFSGYLS